MIRVDQTTFRVKNRKRLEYTRDHILSGEALPTENRKHPGLPWVAGQAHQSIRAFLF